MPTLAFSQAVAQSGLGGGTATTSSFTPQTGDILVVKVITADASNSTVSTPTGGGWTYTQRVSDTTASHVGAKIWTAPVTAGGTAQTVSVTFSGTDGRGQMSVGVWRNAQLAATPATCDARGSGAPSTPLTTVAASSIVSWVNGDWAAVDGTSRTYNTTSATPTETGYDFVSGAFTAYDAYQSAPVAGTQTLGLTAPAGQTWTLVGIEIQDNPPAATAQPAPSPAIPPGRQSPMAFQLLGQTVPQAGALPPTPVSQGDVAAGTEADAAGGFKVSVSTPPSDAGAATEAIAISAATPETEAAGAVESLSVTVTVPLADAGGAVDSQVSGMPVSLADAGAGTDSVAVSAAVPLADAAGAADQVSVSAAVPSSDVAGAAEAIAITGAIPLAEVAGAVESLLVNEALPAGDVAGAADSLSVTVVLSLADVAGATEIQLSGVPVSLADAAGAAEQVVVAAAVPLPDVAGVVDVITAAVTSGSSDVAGAAEALAAIHGIGAAETAGAVDQLSVTVSVALSDAGAAAESEGVNLAVSLADMAAGADYILVISAALKTGTVYWVARPEHGRWRPHPAPPRWKAAPAAGRWRPEPGTARWKATPAPARWTAVLQTFDPIASDSAEEVNIRWTSDLDGTSIDPTVTPLPVQAGFAPSSGNLSAPARPGTWYTGSWLSGGTGKGFVSQHLTGPGTSGPTLTAGKYDVWGYIQGTPESPRKFVGVLTVY